MSNWTEVVALEDIPMLGARVVDAGKMKVAVFRTSNDQVFAIRNECPHKGGPLSEGIVLPSSSVQESRLTNEPTEVTERLVEGMVTVMRSSPGA